MNDGWVKLYRKLADWQWADSPETLAVFIHLLIMANHKPNEWHGQKIETGSLVTSRQQLSKKTGVSEMGIRTILGRLKSTNEITSKSTNKYTVISINNFGQYQQTNQQTNQQSTSNQPATNHKQECKNEKNVINTLLLTKSQKEKLRAMFPNKNVEEEILKANDYLRSTGVVKNDYLAWFRNWLRKENYQQGGRHVRRISIIPIE
jgi:hypothetical protein